MSNFPILYTNRCKLMPLKEKDVYWFNQIINQDDVLNNMKGFRLFAKSVADTKHFIRNINRQFQDGNAFLWSIIYNDIPIGFIGICDITVIPNLFYALNKKQRCQGLMTECVKVVAKFVNTNLNIVLSTTVECSNVASIRVLEKNGFSFHKGTQLYKQSYFK